MHYILIWAIMSGYGYSSGSQEFGSEQGCIEARSNLIASFSSGLRDVEAFCVRER